MTIFIIFMLLCDLVRNFKDNIFEHVHLVKSNLRKSVVFEEKGMEAEWYRVIY